MNIEKISNILGKIMLCILGFILISTLYLGTSKSSDYISAFVYALILFYLWLKVKPKFINVINKLGAKKCFVILSILCLVIKALWIIFVKIQPSGDYGVFYGHAVKLSENFFTPNKYIAAFPHYFGYANFLSIFFKIFGESHLIAPILNVIITLLTGMLLFKIVKNLINLEGACMAYLLWILCPSQTIYNSLVLSEPLYTLLIITFIFLITKINDKIFKNKALMLKAAGLGIIGGLLLRMINVCRPIAAILIIALFIWIFILNTSKLKNKSFIKIYIPFIVSLIIIYVLTGMLWNIYAEKRLGEKPASIPGFTILTGSNVYSGGKWNEEDGNSFAYYYDQKDVSAFELQEKLFAKAKNRILTGKISYTYFFKNKLLNFMGSDDAAVGYHSVALLEVKDLKIISNIFYYFLLILGIFGIKDMINNYKNNTILFFSLYAIGLTLAHMLVEVALRYHYSIIPMLIVIASYTLYKKEKLIKEELE